MGPDATVDFMSRVIELTPADSEQEHVRLLVDQNPHVPNRQAAILDGGEDPAPALVAMARGLESQGADFLVIPCNTAHAFAAEIRAAVRIPLVSIVDASLDAAGDAASVGLLATAGCLDANIYQPEIERRGMTLVAPGREEALEINELVFDIKVGKHDDGTVAALRNHAEGLVERGAEVIVAACTEIPLVIHDGEVDVPLLSSTEELARKTVAIATGSEALPEK